MLLTKFYRSLRKPRVTTLAGLVTFKRLADQLGLLDSLEEPDFQKLYGHSLKSIFVAMLIKALMGCPSLNEFEKQLANRPLIGKMAGCTTKIGKTVLGRNVKRFKPAFLLKTYENIIHKLLAQGIVTLRRVAIDCTFIEVFGETYQKATPGWGPSRTALGYRLAVVFDLDSKLPVAYILTYGCKHDSQFLLPLIELLEARFGRLPERVVLDRGFYGQDFFRYLTEKGIEFEIPVKWYASIGHQATTLLTSDFTAIRKWNLHYADRWVAITGYGYLRVIWLTCKTYEEWMPPKTRPKELWGILTNRTDLPPKAVIQAYRARWEIEVFFRGLCQRLALNSLPGRDFRQVQAHIFFVFSAYILLMLTQHLT